MAIEGNGTTGTITSATSITPPGRYTIHFFYKNAAAPGIAVVDKPFSIADATSVYDLSFCWDHTVYPVTFFHRQASGTYAQLSFSGMTSNVWYGLGFSYDGSNVTLYRNGATFGTVPANDPPITPSPSLAALAGSAGTGNFDDGDIAEVGVWDVALTAAEISALGSGYWPMGVRPQSLVAYWPLVRTSQGRRFGPDITEAGGLTTVVHPPVSYGDQVQIFRYTDNATHVFYPSGGLVVAGTATQATAYTHTGAGGVVIGGAATVFTQVNMTESMAFTEAGPQERSHVRDALTLTEVLATPENYGTTSDTLAFDESFVASSGYLATDRATDKYN